MLVVDVLTRGGCGRPLRHTGAVLTLGLAQNDAAQEHVDGYAFRIDRMGAQLLRHDGEDEEPLGALPFHAPLAEGAWARLDLARRTRRCRASDRDDVALQHARGSETVAELVRVNCVSSLEILHICSSA